MKCKNPVWMAKTKYHKLGVLSKPDFFFSHFWRMWFGSPRSWCLHDQILVKAPFWMQTANISLLSWNGEKRASSLSDWYIYIYIFFFFCHTPQHVEVLGPEIELMTQKQPKLLLWQQRILNPLHHQHLPIWYILMRTLIVFIKVPPFWPNYLPPPNTVSLRLSFQHMN